MPTSTETVLRVLVIEDDPAHAALVRRAFDDHAARFGLSIAASVREARMAIENLAPDLVITDVRLPDGDGCSLLESEEPLPFPVIVMTGHGREELAVAAMKAGASDYVVKSPAVFAELPDLALSISKGWLQERNRERSERAAAEVMRRELDSRFGFDSLVGGSQAMRETRERIRQVAPTSSTVLITGESGVGKEVVARSIHRSGRQASSVFLPVNCAAIPADLLESQLFGHMRGSFSGAVADYEGLFQKASGGTIFLDEIGELPVALQSKILRAIETKEVLPVGSTIPIKVDLRILAATNRDLEKQVSSGEFREDLFYRLNVFAIEISPLRERLEDIPALVNHFINQHNQEMKHSFQGIEDEAVAALLGWSWKGNVRELDNVIEHAMIVGDGEYIRLSDLPSRLAGNLIGSETGSCPHTALKSAVRYFERAHISAILRMTSGDKKQASELLEIGVSTLYRKLEELGVDSEGNLVEDEEVSSSA